MAELTLPLAGWSSHVAGPSTATTGQGFFEFGPDQVRTRAAGRGNTDGSAARPALPRSAPAGTRLASPLVTYRWAHTGAALTAQLELEAEASDAPVSGKLNLLRTEVTA